MNETTDNDPAPSNGQAPRAQPGNRPTAEATRAPFPDGPINILIVDDEPKNLTVLETILDDPGYRLVRADSADQALLALVVEEFALLILDIRMPGMTGFELAQMIKDRKKTARVPIIFLTAYYNEDQHVLEGYGTGAVDYLHKPVNPAILRSKVAVFAELHRKNRECGMANRALLTEITQRRRAEEQLSELNETLEQRVIERTEALVMANTALNEASERYRSLFDGSLDAIISLDADGRFETANPAALRITGRTLHELKTLHFQDLCAPDQQAAVRNALLASCCRECSTLDATIITADGERRELFISGAPAIVNGEVVGVSCIARDVTDRRQAEKALKEADRRKDEFLATLAHELRNPLAPIRNGLQIMQLAETNGETLEQVRTMMERQLGQMIRLVDDLLDVSRISQGKLVLRKERVELAAVLNNAVETSRPLIESCDHQLTVDLPPSPVWLNGDVIRLGQIFANLLNNAAKYSERGGHIRLNVERQRSDVAISIKDAGVGIPSDMLPKIFDMFTQVDRSLEKSQSGLGIGLTLVKRLVEMHGGSIEARSEGQGRGSEFVVRLPVMLAVVQEVEPSTEAGESAGAAARYRILVADDNEDSATTLAMILKMMGNEVRTANDGLQAVDMAAEFRPDVILLDIGMPKLNGYEVCRRIREQPGGKELVIIAQTGWGQQADRQRTHEAGFNHHMVKPIDPAALEKLLAGLTVPAT